MLTRKEADRLVRAYGAACIGVGAYNQTPAYYSACRDEDRLRPELIAALCADPNAALVEACKKALNAFTALPDEFFTVDYPQQIRRDDVVAEVLAAIAAAEED